MKFCVLDLGTSDDSSLSDSVVQDEGKIELGPVSTSRKAVCFQSSVGESKTNFMPFQSWTIFAM